MIQFTSTISKFDDQGEKTGWRYIHLSSELAQQLMPGNKKAFRVKGYLDDHRFEKVSLIPMGGGNFIMAINATMRKAIHKKEGAMVYVKMEVDTTPIVPPVELLECLADEPQALAHFNQLPKSHQNYFTRWINEAKTEATKTKRIAQAVTALSQGMDFGETIRSIKAEKNVRSF